MEDVYPVKEPEYMHLETPDGSIVEFSKPLISILTRIALRNEIGYAGALLMSIQNEEFITRLEQTGAKLILEEPNGNMRYLERRPLL
jgi:hypothetical protein